MRAWRHGLPQPQAASTAAFAIGLAATWLVMSGNTPSDVARQAAIGVALSALVMLTIEAKRGLMALLRADLVCMVALYYLLFAEFLVPQPELDAIARDQSAIEAAIGVAMISMVGMCIGRHLVGHQVRRWPFLDIPVPTRSILLMFWISAASGYFHMLLAVDFSPSGLIEGFLGPRFSAPWGRPQLGDLSALIYELGATIYLLPPLAGLILGRRAQYSTFAVLGVTSVLLLTLFYGFSTGTRNVMAAFLMTFLVSFFYASGSVRRTIPPAVAAAGLMLASTVYGLEFRNIGLGAYVSDEYHFGGEVDFYVDYNLWTISEIISVFPSIFPYIGIDMPIWLLVRVIPRALWPGKPTGESVAAESYLQTAAGTTLSSTFIGESYMAAGMVGVVVVGVALGFMAMWWTRKTFSPNSDMAILFYGSGFFAVVLTMRSIYMLPVAVMPILALWAFSLILVRRAAKRSDVR